MGRNSYVLRKINECVLYGKKKDFLIILHNNCFFTFFQ